MFDKKRNIWGAYAAMLAAFVILTLAIPHELTRVFYTALIGTVGIVVISAIDSAVKLRRLQAEGRKLHWPDMFTILVIQLVFYAFLVMGSVFCPYYICVVAELIVYAATLVIVVGEERLRDAVRWLYSRRKAVAVIVVAMILAVPAVHFGVPFAKYKWAGSILKKGDYARAAEMFAELGDYLEAPVQRQESLFRLGRQLNEAGDPESAYFTLADITGYEGVQAYIDGDAGLAAVRDEYGAYNVGGIVTLGTWQGEPLQWGVLDQRGSMRLLFAVEAVDQRAFNDVFDITYWENSSLRAWLNGEFLASAFTEAELARILETEVVNADNAMYRTEAGDDTVDRIFLLSIDEAEQYRHEYRDWFVDATNAMWLRSPGCSRIDAATVSMGGGVDEMGTNINWDNVNVRPVMWVDILDIAE